VLILKRELVLSFCKLCPSVNECGDKIILISADVCCVPHQQARNTKHNEGMKARYSSLCSAALLIGLHISRSDFWPQFERTTLLIETAILPVVC